MAANSSERWQLDEWRLSDSKYPPDLRLKAHCDGHFRISVVVAGRLRERLGGFEEEASALSVVSKPADARHSDAFGPEGARLVSIEVPPSRLGAPGRAELRLRRWRWSHVEVLPQALGLFHALRNCRGGAPAAAEELGERVDLLLDALATVATPRDRVAPKWLRSVRARLHDAAGDPTSVQALAAEAGVHRTHLTRWFHAFYGCSVTTYRLRLRGKAATESLAGSEAPLSRVALEAGFCDQSHLTHVFRRQTGKTPAFVRRLVRRA